MLHERGITLIAADSPDAFLDDTPTAVLIRQVVGAVSQFEKAMLVSQLKARGTAGGRAGSRESPSVGPIPSVVTRSITDPPTEAKGTPACHPTVISHPSPPEACIPRCQPAALHGVARGGSRCRELLPRFSCPHSEPLLIGNASQH
jgi:hypothetical protein